MQIKTNNVDNYIANKKDYHPIVLVYGPNSGLVSERAKTIIKNLNEDSNNAFSVRTLDNDTLSNNEGLLIDELQTVGLFSEKKIIKLRLHSNKSILNQIKIALDIINSDTNLIIEAGNLPKSNALRTLIEKSKKSAALPCYNEDERSLRNIIRYEFKQQGITIDHDALDSLVSSLSEDRQICKNEISKLILYSHNTKKLHLNDIEMLINDTASSITEQVIDNTLIGNGKKALIQFSRGLSTGTPAYQTAYSFQQHFLLLYKFCLLKERNFSLNSIVDNYKPPIHFKRKNIINQQIQIWNSTYIQKAQNQTLETIKQSRLKSGIDEQLMAELILKLATVAKQMNR